MIEPHKTAARFHTTRWTLIRKASASPEALECLLAMYWSPVYAFLRCKGHSRDHAADLTQGFFANIVLDRKLIEQADERRGRFRNFLMSALCKFVVDEYRHEHGRNGQRATAVSLDEASLAAADPGEDEDPTRAFDRQWATTVVNLAIEQVEQACEAEGLSTHWTLYETRELQPLRGCEATPVDELIRRFGLSHRDDVYNMVHTIKRKLARAVERIVSETLDDPEDLASEIANLKLVLRR